jgi:hypothetical protein
VRRDQAAHALAEPHDFRIRMTLLDELGECEQVAIPIGGVANVAAARFDRIAPLAADLLTRLQEKLQASRFLLACAVVVFLVSFGGLTVKEYLDLRTDDYRAQAAFWTEVGNAIGHQPGVIALTGDYGDPLKYYGWQNSDPWPPASDVKNFPKTFALLAGYKSYFLITDFEEFDLQPRLKQFLHRYPILVRGKGFLVYDLLHRLKPAKK